MAKLRRNYESNSSDVSVNVRIFIFAVILLGLLYFGWDYLIQYTGSGEGKQIILKTTEGVVNPQIDSNDPRNSNYSKQETGSQVFDEARPWLPSSTSGTIINHTYYSLSYVEAFEQAEWVAYPLTQEILRKPNVPRTDYFFDDPLIPSQSATFYDYKGSGYTKGHLAPAADMAFDTLAMRESFYMSNMSPQLRAFNNGIWRELEEQTRDWVYHNNAVYIVSGPVLDQSVKMSKKGVGIPNEFFKIILDIDGPEKKAIAFLLPHVVSDRPLQDFAVTIDVIEARTGINFFPHLMDQNLETKIEAEVDVAKWKFSDARYQLRVKKWNFE
ncbi:MAG: DNA/RNA non-specific endonuclease [Saprospiraceae bacterium]